MKTSTALVATLIAVTSFPVLAQQPSPASQSNMPADHKSAPGQTPPGTQPAAAQPAQSESAPATSAALPMKPVSGELISKLDSKTARAGDNVVIETKASLKTVDGTEIPKGSKLVGHVVAAQASAAGAGSNSQVALEFDHIELKGGQNLAVQSQIQSISPAGGEVASASAPVASGASSAPSGSTSMTSPNGSNTANGTSMANGTSRAGTMSQGSAAEPAAAPSTGGAPAAGTVVAHNGNIAISTTAIPGVLLANNAPGQQDPRMAKASSILLGAKKDIQLENGTQVVVGLAAAGGGQ